MNKYLFILPLVISLSACDLAEMVKPSPTPKPTIFSTQSKLQPGLPYRPQDNPASKLSYTEEPSFDTDLSSAMGKPYDTIDVKLPKDIDPDEGEMPRQLNKWLAAIEAGGGEVKYEPLQNDMSLGLALTLISLSFKAYEFINEFRKTYQTQQSLYSAAERYDARLCFRQDDNLVSKVVFVKRDQAAEKACTYEE